MSYIGRPLFFVTVNATHIKLYEQALASPVMRGMLKQARRFNDVKSISILGVPHDAVRVFIRFLYSSWYVRSLNQSKVVTVF